MKYLFLFFICLPAFAADNTIHIQNIGDNNQVIITQQGNGHEAYVAIEYSDNNVVNIDQKDYGIKKSLIDIKGGINNGIQVNQQDSGSHISLIDFSGSSNNITITQGGGGNHSAFIFGSTGTINDANNITIEQQGGSGVDKTFNLDLHGSAGATVAIQQLNTWDLNE